MCSDKRRWSGPPRRQVCPSYFNKLRRLDAISGGKNRSSVELAAERLDERVRRASDPFLSSRVAADEMLNVLMQLMVKIVRKCSDMIAFKSRARAR